MKIVSVIAFAMTALGSMGVCAQTMGEAPAMEADGGTPAQKSAHKASCERDARLTYRIGRNVGDAGWQQQVKASRRAFVQDCMEKAGFTP